MNLDEVDDDKNPYDNDYSSSSDEQFDENRWEEVEDEEDEEDYEDVKDSEVEKAS